jgi:hypothetical protein
MYKNSAVQFNYLKYEQMYADFCNGKISESEWVAFCLEILEDLMRVNESVLLRLKYRGEN